MNNAFFDKSKEIANDFIQSVVFLDDRAYKEVGNESQNHDFDVQKITQTFAKENKICAVYSPSSEEDIENFKLIANKADVVILDWQIIIQGVVEAGSEEEDEPDDPRGVYTKDVIKSILFEDNQIINSLKLIIVYTGDYTLLEAITEGIYSDVFNSDSNFKFDKDSCTINSSKIKILVRSKETEIGNIANSEKYKSQMLSYDAMPAFILNEYTKMTFGLLSNFALMSLSNLRKNSSKIIGLFSKDMDSAYLGHKATIPKQEDAEDLLIELFGDSVKDLLYYFNISEVLRDELIESWIDEMILEEDYTIGQKTFKRTSNLTKDILNSSEESIENRFNSLLDASLSKKEKASLMSNATALYTNEADRNESEKKDKKFSKLTHHKSLFIPKSTQPKLTLGTLIKSNKNHFYYICIQQKCDSVRIPKEGERKFLFIPLTESSDRFDILTPEGIKLKKIKTSFSIRTIKFVCPDDSGVIIAEKNDAGKYVFKQKYTTEDDEQFEWILDLKDLHAQRIIIDYTSQLSRVGLDESEWHRKQLS